MSQNIQEKLQTFRTQRDELLAQITDAAKEVFAVESKELFTKFPKLKSFNWHQYTPYFNDGEACEFRTCTDYIKLGYEGVEADEDEEYDYMEYTSVDENGLYRPWRSDEPRALTEVEVCTNAIIDFLRNFEDDDLLAMFGDHVEITVTADSIEVDTYNHD